jgi:hypothetical protein
VTAAITRHKDLESDSTDQLEQWTHVGSTGSLSSASCSSSSSIQCRGICQPIQPVSVARALVHTAACPIFIYYKNCCNLGTVCAGQSVPPHASYVRGMRAPRRRRGCLDALEVNRTYSAY